MKQLYVFLLALLFLSGTVQADIEKLVILGGGPAGLTAAIFAGQAHLNPLVIEGELAAGQYGSVYKLENFPGFPEGISGVELNEKLSVQAKAFGARLQPGKVMKVDLAGRPFQIELADGTLIAVESLIIATGASPKWLGLEGEESLIGKGVSANAMVDGPQYAGQEVIVIGGGDVAMEQALILAEYASQVTIIYKSKAFYASSYLQERVAANSNIECLMETEVIAIQDIDQQAVSGVTLQHTSTKELADFSCKAIFVANGRKPNTDIFKGQLEMTETGYLITKPDSTESSIPGIFIAGDIAQKAYRKMVTSAASGCMAAIDVTRFVKENP